MAAATLASADRGGRRVETTAWASWAGLIVVALLYYWLAGVSVVIGIGCLGRRTRTGLAGLLIGAGLLAAATAAAYLAINHPSASRGDFRAFAEACRAATLGGQAEGHGRSGRAMAARP